MEVALCPVPDLPPLPPLPGGGASSSSSRRTLTGVEVVSMTTLRTFQRRVLRGADDEFLRALYDDTVELLRTAPARDWAALIDLCLDIDTEMCLRHSRSVDPS